MNLTTYTNKNNIAFKIYQHMHQDLNSREQHIGFLKQTIRNELNDCSGLNREQVQQNIANRIEMIDLMDSVGASIQHIEDSAYELITDEELDFYRDFKLIPVGLYVDINLRR